MVLFLVQSNSINSSFVCTPSLFVVTLSSITSHTLLNLVLYVQFTHLIQVDCYNMIIMSRTLTNQYLSYKMCQTFPHNSHTYTSVTIWVKFSVTIWVKCEHILYKIGTLWVTHIGQNERFYLPRSLFLPELAAQSTPGHLATPMPPALAS